RRTSLSSNRKWMQPTASAAELVATAYSLGPSTFAAAQAATATLSGVVDDTTDAVLPAAGSPSWSVTEAPRIARRGSSRDCKGSETAVLSVSPTQGEGLTCNRSVTRCAARQPHRCASRATPARGTPPATQSPSPLVPAQRCSGRAD